MSQESKKSILANSIQIQEFVHSFLTIPLQILNNFPLNVFPMWQPFLYKM